MAIDITNAVLVHELWSDLADTTLIAQCQYITDAEALVAVRLAHGGGSNPDHRRYIITNLYDGKQFVRAWKEPKSEAKP